SDLHLSKIEELNKVLEAHVSKLDIESTSRLGLNISKLEKGVTNWKNVLKGYEENADENMEMKEKEKQYKELQKILKPLIAIQEKIEEHMGEIKDVAENKTSIMQETKKM